MFSGPLNNLFAWLETYAREIYLLDSTSIHLNLRPRYTNTRYHSTSPGMPRTSKHAHRDRRSERTSCLTWILIRRLVPTRATRRLWIDRPMPWINSYFLVRIQCWKSHLDVHRVLPEYFHPSGTITIFDCKWYPQRRLGSLKLTISALLYLRQWFSLSIWKNKWVLMFRWVIEKKISIYFWLTTCIFDHNRRSSRLCCRVYRRECIDCEHMRTCYRS